jgi:hypothetical protein
MHTPDLPDSGVAGERSAPGALANIAIATWATIEPRTPPPPTDATDAMDLIM